MLHYLSFGPQKNRILNFLHLFRALFHIYTSAETSLPVTIFFYEIFCKIYNLLGGGWGYAPSRLMWPLLDCCSYLLLFDALVHGTILMHMVLSGLCHVLKRITFSIVSQNGGVVSGIDRSSLVGLYRHSHQYATA